ncbi:MAG: Nucleoid-associated protein [Verrucomicrobia subdivision 3 bacterium]|nr:Nucleoid-associated protein [Limisphaerales bacterium]MCS1414513.1 Nucleoid-associated protein [Limisphaerales bacterium]
MSSIGKLMKQATRIQKDMEEAQAALADRTVEASSGGGAIKVVAKCDGTLESVKIDPQAVNAEEISLLEDLVLTAVNSGLNQAKEVSNDEMGKLTSGFKIPGLMS